MKKLRKVKVLAMLLAALLLLSACGGAAASSTVASGAQSTGSTNAEEPTNIIWMVRYDEPANKDAVMEAINAKLLEDLNMTLDMRFIAPGDYETKMQMAMAAGDEWDLCFTADWTNNFVNNAGKGAYLELDALIDENAPDVKATVPERYWDAMRVNGKLYGMMNYQVMYQQAGMFFFKDIADEVGISEEQLRAIEDWDDLDEIFAIVKEKKPEIYATRGLTGAGRQFLSEEITTVLNAPYLAFDPTTNKISNTYYFEQSAKNYEVAREWREKGYAPTDAATLKDEMSLLKAQQIFSRYNRMKPGTEVGLRQQYGHECIAVEMSGKMINTSAAQSTVTAVNANSKNPEKAMQLYNYFFTNKEAFNMLIYGLEGQDYEKLDGDFIRKTDGTYNAPAWMLGNQFLAYLNEGDEADVWEQTIKANDEAQLDPLFGFVPDRTSVEAEMATCEAIWIEYKDILEYGLQDHTVVVPEMLNKMELAGLEKITTEMQSQVDAFLATK